MDKGPNSEVSGISNLMPLSVTPTWGTSYLTQHLSTNGVKRKNPFKKAHTGDFAV